MLFWPAEYRPLRHPQKIRFAMESRNLFDISVIINAPPGHVWGIMADVERWPEWTTSVRKVRRLQDGPLTVGSKMWIYQPKLPPALWHVTALEHESGFTGTTSSPGVTVTAHHAILPASEGSRVTLSIRFSGLLGPLLARMTSSLNNRYLKLEADGLKKRSEETYSS